MATNGLIQGTVSQQSGHYRSFIYWRQLSQDVSGNKTQIRVEVLIDSDSTGWNWNGTVSNFKLTINGSTYTSGNFNSNSVSSWSYTASSSPTGRVAKIIYTKDVWITHSADGSKSVPMSSTFSLPAGGYGPGSVSISGSGTLNTIPRASTPTLSASSRAYGSSVVIYTNRASSSFTHRIRYNWNGRTGTIATGVTTSYTWTVPLSFMNYIPNATSTSGTIYLDTYNGSSLIGTKSVKLTTSVPSNVVPSFSSITHSEYVSYVKDHIGSYVQGLSRLNMEIVGATGSYSSTIKSYSITFNGATYNSKSAVSGYINGSGTLTITGKVTDSRGRTASKSVTVSVLPYQPPKISLFDIKRCDEDGVLDDAGVYVKIKIVATWNVLSSKNPANVMVKSKERKTQDWEIKESKELGTEGSYNEEFILSDYSEIKSFDFMLEFADLFNTTISLSVLPTGQYTMSWGPQGIGVGKVHERGAIDAGDRIYARGVSTYNYFEILSYDEIAYGKGKMQSFFSPNAKTLYVYGREDDNSETGGERYPITIDLFQAGILGQIRQGNWIQVTSFLNGWQNYSGTGGGFIRTYYRKTTHGTVQIIGFVRNGTANNIFRLPESYAPSATFPFSQPTGANANGRVDVTSGGLVVYQGSLSVPWVSLILEFPLDIT